MKKQNDGEGLIWYVGVMLILTMSLGIVGGFIYNQSVSEDLIEITGTYNGWEYKEIGNNITLMFKINDTYIDLNYTGDPDTVLTREKVYTFYIDENNYLVKWKEW